MLESWQALVYSICLAFVKNPYDAEDLAQETFVTAWSRRDSYRQENPKSWLCTIAANKCKDFLKSRARSVVPADEEELKRSAGTVASAEQEVFSNYSDRAVLDNCMSLPEPYREVAIAYYCRDETIREISDRTQQNQKTVATRLYRARDRLRNMYRRGEVI